MLIKFDWHQLSSRVSQMKSFKTFYLSVVGFVTTQRGTSAPTPSAPRSSTTQTVHNYTENCILIKSKNKIEFNLSFLLDSGTLSLN